MNMSEPQLVKVTKEFSDGTSTEYNFTPNPRANEIEEAVAESVADQMEPVEEASVE